MKPEVIAILQKMIDALDIEISTIQSENLPNRVNVKNGRLVKRFEKSFIYRFDVDDLFSIKENTTVEINHQNNTYKGTILSCTNLDLLLSLENEIVVDSVSQLILLFNRTSRLEKLKTELEKIQEKHRISNEDLVAKSFGLINMNPVKDTNVKIPDSGVCLDEYQQECIQHCMGSEVSFVWGMPGAGKTITITHLIEMLSRNNDSILFLTVSNSTVDSTLEKFFTYFKDKSNEIANGDILRYGTVLNDQIRDFVNESGLIERKTKPRLESINAKQEQVKAIVEEVKVLQNELKEREQLKVESDLLKNLEGKLSLYKDELTSNINLIKSLEQNIQDLNNQILQKKEELKLSESLSSVSRMMKGVTSPEKIKASLASVENEVKNAQKQKNEKEEQDKSYKVKITDTEAEISKLKEKLTSISSKYTSEQAGDIQKVHNHINELTSKQKHILYEISKLNNEIQEIDKITVNETKIIAGTVSDFYSSAELCSKFYDVIIIDEAAKLTLPEIFFASCFAKKKIMYFGDFLIQQPSVFAEENDQVATWIKRDIFKTIGIGDRDDKKVILDPRVVTLKKQRKIPEAAAEILNNGFYEKRILTAVSADNLIPGDRPVSLFDTSKYNPYAIVLDDNYNRINIFNTSLCLEIVQKYYKQDGIKDIGIVTLYYEQANFAAKILKELKLDDKVFVNVINEPDDVDRDVVILDIPEGANSKGYSLGKVLEDNKISHLFSSVIARARKKFIVIVNRKYLLNYVAALNDSIIKILGTITKSTSDDFEVVEPNIIFPEITVQDGNSGEINGRNIKHLSKDLFNSMFASELNKEINEIKELVIYSPVIDKETAEKFDGIFNDLKSKDSNIALITLPLKDQSQDVHNIIDNWMNSGIHFRFVDGLIERLVIVNNETIFYGNVNILSKNEGDASMLRISGLNTIKQIINLYTGGLFGAQYRAAKIQKDIPEDLPF